MVLGGGKAGDLSEFPDQVGLVVVTAFVGTLSERKILPAELFEEKVHAGDATEFFWAQADGGGKFSLKLAGVETGEADQLVDGDLSLLFDDVIEGSSDKGIGSGG